MDRLSLFEIESFVRGLKPLGLASVGSDVWMAQHEHLEKLNIQAHHEVSLGKHDEYVVEQLTSQQGKVEVLIHELLVIEAWKAYVFPLLLSHFSPLTSVKAYIVLYHEATLCNLLEVLMYHASACDAGGEAMIELGDYCARKVNLLLNGTFKRIQDGEIGGSGSGSKSTMSQTTQEQLQQQQLEIDFSVAVCSTSILRFLSDHVNVLPLGVVSRMLHTHDILLSMVPLVESPPWTRRRKDGKLEKFSDQRWLVIQPQDALLMTKLEGQVWLTIYNLIMDKSCRKQYQYNTHRKEVLIRLKRFFTDILMDQLPLLRELKRFIEELSIMEPPPPTASSMAIIEQVPEMRDGILKDCDFKKLAEQQCRTVFANDEASRQRDIARLAATYNMDAFEDLLPTVCGGCGLGGVQLKKCSRCKSESYCGRPCQVASWKRHQKSCDVLFKQIQSAQAAAAAKNGTPNNTPSAAPAAASTTTAPSKTDKKPTPAAATTKPTAPAATPAPTAAAATAASATAPKAASSAGTQPSTSSSSASASSSTSASNRVPVASSTTPITNNSNTSSSGSSKSFASGKIVMLDDDDEEEATENPKEAKEEKEEKTTNSGLDDMD